jgi:DNA-binding transcriptional LysR family regulator
MDQLQSMRVFIKVADLGSFAKAATHLDLSNAVVTRHVADLEGRLGTRLLHRTTRSLSLTEAGQVYKDRVRQILDELDDVEQVLVERTHEPMGTLRIAAPVVFGLHNLASVLASYKKLYPRVVPDMTLVDRQIDLVEEGYDVGIMIMRSIRSGSIITRRLARGRMVVCATPEYLARLGTPVHPAQLGEHACLSLPHEYWGDEHVFTGRDDKQVRVRPTNVAIANNTDMLRQLALQGLGIAILPSYLVGNDIMQSRLVSLMPDYRLPMIDVNIAYPSRRHLPAKVRTFVDHLVEHFRRNAGDDPEDSWLAPPSEPAGRNRWQANEQPADDVAQGAVAAADGSEPRRGVRRSLRQGSESRRSHVAA